MLADRDAQTPGPPAGPDARTATFEYRPDIDGLRALAVLAVVGFHAFPQSVQGGFVGVDVFFVVSGYLISGIILSGLQQGDFSLAGFYARRVRRIFPALLLVLAACLAAGWVVLIPHEYAQLGEHVVGGATFVSNILLWNQAGYFDNAAETKPLLHLWSLGVEEQFYVIWPWVMVWCWSRRPDLLLITALVAILSFALNVTQVERDAVGTFFSPATRFWEILAGSVLAYLATAAPAERPGGGGGRLAPLLSGSPALRHLAAAAGLALILAAALALDRGKAFPGWWALLPTAGTCLVIAAGRRAWLNRVALSWPPLVWIGLISYPLYLWHWPLLSFARIVDSGEPAPAVRAGLVLASVALAWLTYAVVERRVRFGAHGKAKVALLCALMAAAGFAGRHVEQGEGLASRFPQEIVKVLFATGEGKAWSVNTRSGPCYRENSEPGFAGCFGDAARPLLFIWGDSHAAALYPGFRALQESRGFGIDQFNVNGCPPILDFRFVDQKTCDPLNARAFAGMQAARPDIVVLHAYWTKPSYGLYAPGSGRIETGALASTIEKIKQAGVRRIILVGPVPAWKDDLKRVLFEKVVRDPLRRLPPIRLSRELLPGLVPMTDALRQLAARTQIEFVSPLDALCDAQGCLTRLGDPAVTLTAIDYAHLSAPASRLVAGAMAPILFPAGIAARAPR